MASHAEGGASALAKSKYEDAVTHYTAALGQAPSSPAYRIGRSTAYARLPEPRHDLALQDAEEAVRGAHQRGRRELIASSQFRRGVAYFGLQQWNNAGLCFAWARRSNDKEPGLAIWERKVEVELEKAGETSPATAEEIPKASKKALEESQQNPIPKLEAAAEAQEIKPVQGVQTPADKIRHDWYQTAEVVVVTILAKGVPKDTTTIDLHDRSLSVSFPMPGSSTYDFSLDPLFAVINPAASSSSIMSTKVELQLKKAVPGQKWKALESNDPVPDTSSTGSTSGSTSQPITSTSSSSTTPAPLTKPPSYPTSSRSGPKDWDKVAAAALHKPKSTNDKDKAGASAGAGEQADEEEEDDFEGDAVNGFFKKLYSSADPDTRRAMMKSYQESNGTALNTNWNEVGKKKVETMPPEGMEVHEWSK